MTWLLRRLVLTPQLAARAVRLVVAEQHIGGPLVGFVVMIATALAAVASGLLPLVVYFFESGIAAEVAILAALVVAAWWTWAGGYCQ